MTGLDAFAVRRFGAGVLAARIAMELTPYELADLAGVRRRVVRAVEDGYGCQLADAVNLARAVGVPLGQLLGTAGAVA